MCLSRTGSQYAHLGLCRHALPLLASSKSQEARAGGSLFLARLVCDMGPALAAHALLLVLPLLPCMSDPWAPTREAAAATFASLVALLPLSLVIPWPLPVYLVCRKFASKLCFELCVNMPRPHPTPKSCQLQASCRICRHMSRCPCAGHGCSPQFEPGSALCLAQGQGFPGPAD